MSENIFHSLIRFLLYRSAHFEESSEELKSQIQSSGSSKVIEGLDSPKERVHAVYDELEKIIKLVIYYLFICLPIC